MVELKGKGTVRLIAMGDEELRAGQIFIVGASKKPNPKVAENTIIAIESIEGNVVQGRVANTKEKIAVKKSRLFMPAVVREAEKITENISKSVGIQICHRHYPIALKCLDGREVSYEVGAQGAEITDYVLGSSMNDKPKEAKKEATTSKLSPEVQAERDRCVHILKLAKKAALIAAAMPGTRQMSNEAFLAGTLDFMIEKVETETKLTDRNSILTGILGDLVNNPSLKSIIEDIASMAKQN